MTQIPQDKNLDSTLSLLIDGYTFIPKRCDRYHTDIFETRFLLEKTICFRGEEAARTFYDTGKFKRKNAAPNRVKNTLFGKGGVQGMDGEAHRHRKQMFMSLMTDEGIQRLATLTREQWLAYARRWEKMERVVLFEEVQEILCRAACAWTAVPLSEAEVKPRTRDLAVMIDSSGAVGLKHWQGQWSRQRAEAWIKDVIQKVRDRQLPVPEDSATYTVAHHRDLEGNLLDLETAAVELLNVVRPTVAVGRYITFAALALHDHPEWRDRLQSGDDGDVERFVQEVRRYYPFFPFAAARVRQDFDWQGYHFPEGRRVLLDLYGTNRDGRLWENPTTFDPDRFRHWDESRFNFIPQGGGDYYTNHRCPGEWITIVLIKVALNVLTQAIEYKVPQQDLTISLSRIPTLPKSRFVISNVRLQHQS
ncbi:MAG: cytochrome P450 [Synechococcales bacterium]|nr:cytochrome P450 [Synechococcales bacterium]